METREWKTIKEYQDILFDFYNGIAKITALPQRIHPDYNLRNQ